MGTKVLFGYDNVLLVWRESDLLFQTYCLYRRILSLLCDSSSLHFFSIISHGFVVPSDCLLTLGFVFFVMTLTPGSYTYQFTQFCWTHMTLLLVVFQAHFIVNSIFEGLIWFFLPVCLVITNDIFAYICGMIWGRTPLIRLSPKKTVEGFIGGWICTVVIGGGIAYYLSKFKYMICPVTVIS